MYTKGVLRKKDIARGKSPDVMSGFRRDKNEPPAGRWVTEARHREGNFSHTATSPFENGLEVMTYVACHFW